MSLDCLSPPEPGSKLPFFVLPWEKIYSVRPNRVSLHLTTSNLPNELKRSKDGVLYLTDQRLIFVSESATDANDFQNFVLLFNKNFFDYKLENSWFGSSKLSLLFKPSFENSGLNHMYTWKAMCHFNNGGIADFLQQLGEAVSYSKWKEEQGGDILPRYED